MKTAAFWYRTSTTELSREDSRLIVTSRSRVNALLAVYFPHHRREGRAAIPFRWSNRLTVVVRIKDNRMLGTSHIDLPEDYRRRARNRKQSGIDTAFPKLCDEHIRIAL